MNEAPADDPPASLPRFLLAILLTGLTAGLGGMLLGMLLHAVQHLAYGYSLDRIVGTETFLQGVEAASDVRRLAVLMLCGLVAGGGWWLVYRFGRPLVSVTQAVQDPAARMPARTTLAHALLQIVTVGLGSPLGREVAPREVGALAAGGVSAWLRLPPDQRRLIVACGAGAGLAAVYNVPLGAALFVLEVLLGTFAWPAAAVALATCSIGAVVAWIGLGNEIQYAVPPMTAGASLIVWAVLAGPVQPFGDVRAELADLLLRRMDGVLRIRDSKLLLFQAPREALPQVLQLLPDAEPPTMCPVDGADALALQALCHGAMTWQRLEDLKRAGARGLMVLPVERMLA